MEVSEEAGMDSEHYRIVFLGQVYNITFQYNVKYQNRTVKMWVSLADSIRRGLGG